MRLAHRSHGASLRAIRTATPARCPVGRPSSRLRARPPRGASPGDRRARAVLCAQHAGIHRGGNATRPRVRITARAERRGAANETTVEGTSEHGTHFFAEMGISASSLPSARFFTQDSTCMIANVGDERCLQCSPTSRSPAAPVDDRWLSRHYPKGHPARARWRATQLARGKSLESPGTQAVGRRANAFTKTRRRRRSHRAREGPGGASGDAPSSGRAHGFESMQDARGAGDWAGLAWSTVSPRTSSRLSSREPTDAGG
jgi:hypothetical protein